MEFRWRVALAAALSIAMALIGIFRIIKPLPNACVMTYMFPTYVPVPAAPDSSSSKYGLFLYHEGWKRIDFAEHLRGLSGVPVLFIPGNGGSYKQVRSLGAESDRAYKGGPFPETYYRDSIFTREEAGLTNLDNDWADEPWDSHHVRDLLADPEVQGEYVNHLDWFAVDLEGEHSALDGRILEEHTDYVVQAIHRILDQYKKSLRTRSGNNKVDDNSLPTSIILVGHSMGGFVARAAVVDPKLRRGAVKTVVTLSSPHLLAPVALQPSLGHFFSRINKLWKAGYELPRTRSGRLKSDGRPPLSNVIVVSIPGGIHDYQVRSRMASLDGIVPATNSLSVGAPGMLNTWLSTEHQTILWCNQLVVQVSHTLLNLVDKSTGQPFADPRTRLTVFIKKFRSALTQTFDWLSTADTKEDGLTKPLEQHNSCPSSTRWESQEKDLHVQGNSVTVLAMDGRRRWMDIKKQLARGRSSFALVTNLSPCVGIRVHLWPERSNDSKPLSHRVIDVTRRMVQLPAGPAPRQIEPGGQTEQAPPSGVLRLTSKDLEGFRYITISVASRPTVFGRPPPATSMAVGHFFNSGDGNTKLSSWSLLSSLYRKQSLHIVEDHPLVMNFSLAVSLGVLPLSIEIETTSCGISDDTAEHDISSLCNLRCFPPLALVWDPYSGLEVIPNLRSETVISDSSPILGGSKFASDQTAMMLLMDPHCGYEISMRVAKLAAISRFFLTHGLQIGGFMVAVVLFALMKQARAWELGKPLPSVFACLERNLEFPLPFAPICVGPLLLHFTFATYESSIPPPYILSAVVALICYVLANGIMALLATSTMAIFHATASFEVFLRVRWNLWRNNKGTTRSRRWFLSRLSTCLNLQMVKRIMARPSLTVGVVATILVFFIHPALGLGVLLKWHIWSCHVALRSHRHQQGKYQKMTTSEEDYARNGKTNGDLETLEIVEPTMCHLESFKFSQGLLLLHLTATCMLLPSLVAWVQMPRLDQTLPWCLDSVLSFGIILHGLCADASTFLNSPFRNPGWSLVYGIAGVYTYWTGLILAPYRAFYPLAFFGAITVGLRLFGRRIEIFFRGKHVHRH